MNLREMAEVAAFASTNSLHLIEGATELPNAPVQAYWRHSRKQQHRWIGCLERFPHDYRTANIAEGRLIWQRIEPIMAEVFICEILTRVWTAVLTAADRRRGLCFAEPIARNVLLGHLKVRHLVLSLMVDGPHSRSRDLQKVDRIRRRAERWTDLLLGHLVARYELGEFAFDERRALDFGSEQLSERIEDCESGAWNLVLAGLQVAFPKTQSLPSANAREHRLIVNAVIATFSSAVLRNPGPFASLLSGRTKPAGICRERPPRIADFPQPQRPAGVGNVMRAECAEPLPDEIDESLAALSRLLNPHQSPLGEPSAGGVRFAKLRRQQRPEI